MSNPELPDEDSLVERFQAIAKITGDILRGRTFEVAAIEPEAPQVLVFPQAIVITGLW